MTPSRRQRLVDSVWPELENLLGAIEGDRSLRKALVRPFASIGPAIARQAAADGSVADLMSGDDVLLERTIKVPIGDLLPSPTSAQPPVVDKLKRELEEFVNEERKVLSWIVKTSTQHLAVTLPAPQDQLVESILKARDTLGQGPLDLLVPAGRADGLAASEHGAAVLVALRGGSIIRADVGADGILVPRFPGPMLMGEVDPLRIDWDYDRLDDGVCVWVSQRLRFFDAVP